MKWSGMDGYTPISENRKGRYLQTEGLQLHLDTSDLKNLFIPPSRYINKMPMVYSCIRE
jgi:hypothetical protein